MYETKFYRLTTLTNLHVGNGEANYSVLDKQVQRDIITNYPQINSSSLKGAIREYITYKGFKKEEGTNSIKPLLEVIFGSSPNDSDGKQGYFNFFDAKLLSLPVRTDKKPFLRATSKDALTEYKIYCHNFGISCSLDIESLEIGHEVDGTLIAEEWKYNKSSNLNGLRELIGEDIILMENEHFKELTKDLPFVARNYLENGKSENLWYEEIVPRESIFYFTLQKPSENTLAYKLQQSNLSKNADKQSKKDEKVKKYFDIFESMLKDAELFIGANTTVGYGKCKIEEF